MTPSLSSGLNWIGLASSFLLVLGLLALLLFALKRMQGMSLAAGGQRQIQQLESLSAGTRQKILLLRVKDREILVGVSPTQITALAEWAPPSGSPTNGSGAASGASGPSVTGGTAGIGAGQGNTLSEKAAAFAPRPSPRAMGSAPAGAVSFAAVLEHARMPSGLVQFFKRKA
jgi:flagellar protein FliO/FliZ